AGFVFLVPDHHSGNAKHCDNKAHYRNQNTPWQAQNATRVHGKLCLHNKVGCSAFPRHPISEQFASFGIQEYGFMPNAASTMTFFGAKEFNSVYTKLPCVPDAVYRL